MNERWCGRTLPCDALINVNKLQLWAPGNDTVECHKIVHLIRNVTSQDKGHLWEQGVAGRRQDQHPGVLGLFQCLHGYARIRGAVAPYGLCALLCGFALLQ